MMDYMQRMIDIREDKDETQAQLTEALKVNRAQWAKYELGINEPPIRYLIEFCKHYRVSADYILGLPKDYEWPR